MKFPRLEYSRWIGALPPAAIDLARSAVDPPPASLLRLTKADLVTMTPRAHSRQTTLRDAIARRFAVPTGQALAVCGGTSAANWLACAAALDDAPRGTEAIVERPTYEPLVAIPRALGCRLRRLDRRLDEGYAIDLDRFQALVTPRTRLAIVTNLHNPSGARIDIPTLSRMAAMLARVKATLLVDEVYLESTFGARPASCVHAGGNVIATSSLTKAYGLDGLRAGWLLGSPAIVRRAGEIGELVSSSGVAPAERMALAAFRQQHALDRRAHAVIDPNLERLRAFFASEPRLEAFVPGGGTIAFPRLPSGIDGDAFAAHLAARYSTLVVPGRFFEAPRHIRISYGTRSATVARGLANLSRALDDLAPANE